ncbi:MAG: hypothetical protein EOR68_12780 [Mesorhizobium sp.]|uniref:hypothetical protein n=1 Tax=Mesorhizobium sp. TaxID=1871066 RepID=UPI000FE6EE46|nr:hypothetical protein [Mesorhizobium sp.]RWL99701.1 MAG: hypothetical protein EOR68_12780 [Mesorhizobium sp.]
MDLKEAIAERLVFIDEYLSVAEIPVSQRVTQAAILFVQDWIIEIEGDDKTDFYVKPWFAILHHHVSEWYRDHYGPALDHHSNSTATGVVLVRGVPVEVRVPLNRRTVKTPGETFWLHFPVTIEDDEDPESWLVGSPPIERLDRKERTKLNAKLAGVGTGLRCIRINLMGIKPHDDTVSGFLEGVLPEFESAAGNILRKDVAGRGTALWSLQMALEKTLKAFAQHKTGSFRQTHDLFVLYDDVRDQGIGAKRDLLKKMPREPQIMSDRYGLGGTPAIAEVMNAYDAALAFVSGASRSFARDLYVGGARFLLKKPPWLELPQAAKGEESRK